MPGFAGTQFLRSQDKHLALACVQAYNDFQTDEWCAAGPGRLIPMMITPMWDPQLCVAEIERMAAKGVKAITFPENTVPLGLPSFHTEHWDPVFAVAEAAGLPLCMHFGTSGSVPQTAPEAPFINTITLASCNSMATTVDLLFSPVFPKFPNLKIALSEGGIGWIPYLIERSDFTWERHRHYQHLGDERPSDVFARHFFGCFIDDRAGLDMRDRIGVDNIMWELDYPHSDSLWPGARTHLEKMVVDIPDDEVAKMGELNARRVFNLD
jgi:predicted TIM-barrel fold metal-dependent hydrolase